MKERKKERKKIINFTRGIIKKMITYYIITVYIEGFWIKINITLMPD